MEIFSLLFIVTLPIAFLVWTLKFKSELVLVALAPLLMTMIPTLMLNIETAESGLQPILTYTHREITNTTSTVVGNTTITVNEYDNIPDTYPLGYTSLQVLNITHGIFIVVVTFIILRRVFQARQSTEE
jgi:hypothetical protein